MSNVVARILILIPYLAASKTHNIKFSIAYTHTRARARAARRRSTRSLIERECRSYFPSMMSRSSVVLTWTSCC